MLVELRLENYAVIDSLVVEFASGLNLLTGETGAGKSILIDALVRRPLDRHDQGFDSTPPELVSRQADSC